MESKTKILVSGLVIVFLIVGWWVWNSNSNKVSAKYDDPKYCETDEDCILIGKSCCSERTIPVNKQHRPECIVECAVASIGKATCVKNQCTFSEYDDVRGGTSESKCKELGGYVTCDSTPEGTDLSCLCCFKDYPNDCRFVK